MTGCLVISPRLTPDSDDRVPTFMADIIATYDPPPGGATPILPSNVTTQTEESKNSVLLVRKLNIINRTILAAAGNGNVIGDYMRELDRWAAENPNDDPITPARHMADRVNQHFGEGSIGVIACNVDPVTGKLHFVAWQGFDELDKMGSVRALGSGAERMLREVEGFEAQLAEVNPVPDGVMKGRLLPLMLNARRFADEMTGAKDLHWGGYVEAATLDPRTCRWTRGPKALHMCIVLLSAPGEGHTASLVSRFLCYDPAGRLLTIVAEREPPNTPPLLWETRLLDRLAPRSAEQEPSREQFWRTGWQPQEVTVTFIAWSQQEEALVPVLQPHILRHDDQVTFNLRGDTIDISLSEETFDRLARTSIEGLGLTYVPLAELRARRAAEG